MKKPVRRVRRVRYAPRGGLKGKFRHRERLHAKGIAAFIAPPSNDDDFFGGEGRSRGRRATGKGKGRKRNAIGDDGRRTSCKTRASPNHLAAQRTKGKGKGDGDDA
eukprot:432717-Pyramimonas_sp.AAC.1